jgi:hypothetical protein
MRCRAITGIGVAAVWLTGCAIEPSSPFKGALAAGGVDRPFAPVVMQVHPLTRLARDGAGKPLVIAHIELRDSWGDTCKGTGKLSVQLYRGERAGGPGVQELRWDINLNDLDLNAQLYDPATRTYRLSLEGLTDRLANPDDRTRLRLRALFQTWGPKGDERTLQDEFVLEP